MRVRSLQALEEELWWLFNEHLACTALPGDCFRGIHGLHGQLYDTLWCFAMQSITLKGSIDVSRETGMQDMCSHVE